MKADNSVVCFETFLGKIYLYKNETFITQEFNKGRYWDIDVLLKIQNYIDPEKNIIEIGAHCGTSSLYYATTTKNLVLWVQCKILETCFFRKSK